MVPHGVRYNQYLCVRQARHRIHPHQNRAYLATHMCHFKSLLQWSALQFSNRLRSRIRLQQLAVWTQMNPHEKTHM